jgi:hypothetical protein
MKAESCQILVTSFVYAIQNPFHLFMPTNFVLFVAALLNHQMEQCMKLERELSMARHEVQEVKGDVIELEKKLNMNQLLTQGKISVSFEIPDQTKDHGSKGKESDNFQFLFAKLGCAYKNIV